MTPQDEATPPQTPEKLVATILETATVSEGHAAHVDLAIRLSKIRNGAIRLATLLAERDGAGANLVKAAEDAAKQAHSSSHHILGGVDRERMPTFRECPYWPCVDVARALKEAPNG